MLDIGAIIGNHSIFFSDFFKNVYAFEPNPIAYKILNINAEFACKNKNISTYNLGLSDKKEKAYFRIHPTKIGGSSIISYEEYYSNSDNAIKVDLDCADEIKSLQGTNIGLIKIDVEGHEFQALSGAEAIIKDKKPIIMFEQGKNEFKNGTSQVINYLKNMNYIFYTFNKSFYLGEKRLERYISFILRTFLGNDFNLKKTSKFQKRHYDLIIAVSND